MAKAPIFVPYWYVVDSPSLTSGAAGQTPLLTDQDADFELWYLQGLTTLTQPTSAEATGVRENRFSVQITDKSNGRVWSSARIQQGFLVTNSGEIRIVRPVLLARRTNLNFDFLNLTTSTLTATCILVGAKVIV